ncbi:hypothetical protein D3C80_868890 [compost metagenome]
MEIGRAKIKIHIAAVINVAVILLRADKGWLREEGPVIIAARILFTVSLPGDIRLFVTPHALFAGPQREGFATQIEIRELFATAVDVIFWLGRQPQPDAVMAGGIVFEFNFKSALIVCPDKQRGTHRIATGKANRPAVLLVGDGRLCQCDFFIQLIFDAEITAKHLDIRHTGADPQAGRFIGMGQNQPVLPA